MHISINTDDGPLSDTDKNVLRALLGDAPAAPAAKTTPAKKTAAAPAKDEPDDAPDEDSTADEGSMSLDEAIVLAKKMVSNGDAAKVKEALTAVGAKKVSEISPAKVDKFVAALG